jgi:hypothetical protein
MEQSKKNFSFNVPRTEYTHKAEKIRRDAKRNNPQGFVKSVARPEKATY